MKGIIKIMPIAAKHVKRILEEKKIGPDYALRVGTRGAGCAGVNHFIAFDKPKEHDTLFEDEGIKVIFDKRQALYLAGMQVNYQEDEDESGFFFEKDSNS